MASTSQSQPNGIQPSNPSQPQSQSQPQATQNSTTITNTQSTTAGGSSSSQQQAAATPSSPTTTSTQAPRPRDARTIELLLTSQGVTSFDSRVPLLLLDFAYRHTSSILNDALHLSGDPYTTHAGAKPSAASGAVPVAPSGGDAVVTSNAINIAIASRQAYQFRGGSGGGGVGGGVGGGGASKEWLQELARERNKVGLPRVLANEWGVRLPNERFVLSGQSWKLRDQWGNSDDDDDDDDDDAMEGIEGQDKNKAREEEDEDEDQGGGLDDFLDADMPDEDEDMEGME